MGTVLLYLLKVNGLLLFFWLFYRFFLRRETFYNFNRWYFLAAIAASFGFPCMTFTKTVFIEETPAAGGPVHLIPAQSNAPVLSREAMFEWQEALFYAVLFISILLVLITVIKIVRLFLDIQKLPGLAGTNIRLAPENHHVYSFYQWIVVPKDIFSWPDYQMVIDHENVHLNQKHTLDLILIELVAKVFWFNPLIKYLQRDLNINLEFLVDEVMVHNHEAVLYQKSLLGIRNHYHLAFTNAFNGSDLRKRIVQLNTLKSNPMKKLKILITAPALLLFFSLFQIKTVAQVIRISDQEASAEALTITPDFNREDLKALKKELKDRFRIDLSLNKVKYKNGNINYLKYTLKKDTYRISGAVSAKDAIKPLTITVNEKNRAIPFSVEENRVRTYVFATAGASGKDAKNDLNSPTVFFNDDKESTKEEVAELDPGKIVSVQVNKSTASDQAGRRSEGIIHITTSNAPGKGTSTQLNTENDEVPGSETFTYTTTAHGKKKSVPSQHLSTYGTTKIISTTADEGIKTIVIKSRSDGADHFSSDATTTFSTGDKVIVKNASSFRMDEKKPFLYVIDGKEVSKEDFSKINPEKIKNIIILKDGSAVKKYGDKAKNGVIEITTGEGAVSFREHAAAVKNREWAVQLRKQHAQKRRELLSERKKMLENRKRELENQVRIIRQKSENS